MPPRSTIVIDCASAPIDGAEAFIEPATAPSNYKDPEKIAAYIREANADRLANAALDLDLAALSFIGVQVDSQEPVLMPCRSERAECDNLALLAEILDGNGVPMTIVTYGGFFFDLPLLMRRAKWLGVPFPKINLDRWKSPHRDLLAELSDRNPSRYRPLSFYVRRHQWTDLTKPLCGAEEALAPSQGRWEELEASVRHDVIATGRLLAWMGA